jgi:AcrR family transcriptional regulator
MVMAESNQDIRPAISEKTVQDKLMAAAEELFCGRGFNETSVRDIAAAAGCNVASVNYYFGGKDKLYLEIWRRRLTLMRDSRLASIDKVMSAGGEPQLEDLLRSYAKSFIEPLVEGGEHCQFISLMAREMIDPHLPRDMYLTEMVLPILDALSEALTGMCPSLDKTRVLMVILSVVGQLLMHTICVKEMFAGSGQAQLARIDLDSIVAHVVEFSAAGIRAFAGGAGEQP